MPKKISKEIGEQLRLLKANGSTYREMAHIILDQHKLNLRPNSIRNWFYQQKMMRPPKMIPQPQVMPTAPQVQQVIPPTTENRSVIMDIDDLPMPEPDPITQQEAASLQAADEVYTLPTSKPQSQFQRMSEDEQKETIESLIDVYVDTQDIVWEQIGAPKIGETGKNALRPPMRRLLKCLMPYYDELIFAGGVFVVVQGGIIATRWKYIQPIINGQGAMYAPQNDAQNAPLTTPQNQPPASPPPRRKDYHIPTAI